MRLDILIPVGEKGGVENVINMTVPYLMEQGVKVRVVQLIWEGVEWAAEGIDFYALIRGLDGHTLLEMIEAYAGFLERGAAPDMILATAWPSMCDVARRAVDILGGLDVVIVSWMHNQLRYYEGSGFGGWDYLGMADVHLAISRVIYDEITANLPEAEVFAVCNPVDFDKCVYGGVRAGQLMHRLYCIGRVDEVKRQDIMIRAVADTVDWELYIIGDDGNRYGKKMRQLAGQLEAGDRVHFIGWKENPWAEVENADALVMASVHEGFPLTAIEAQANGLPVISTPVSGITELIVQGENGYLFPFDDWKALAELLRERSGEGFWEIRSDTCKKKASVFEKNHAVADFYEKLRYIMEEKERKKLEKQTIYRDITQLQYDIHAIIYAFRVQNYDRAIRSFTAMTERLMRILTDVFENLAYYNRETEVVNPEGVSAVLEEILTAQDNRDYILVADLLELQLVPFLQSVQGVIRCFDAAGTNPAVWERNMEALRGKNSGLWKELTAYHERYEREMEQGTWNGRHHLEDTNSGAFTMAGEDERGIYYYHSNADPLEEAVAFARYYYDMSCDRYILWGLGLGYHVRELCRLDDGIALQVFESDLDVIYHCMMTTDFSGKLSAGNVLLEYDPDFQGVLRALDEDTQAFVIHFPSLRHIADERIRKQMEMFFMRDSGKRNAAVLFENNSRENVKHYDGYADDLRSDFSGKHAVIVAAGPSLDKNVSRLKEKPENVLVIATGTVFRKLLSLGIAVDYVIVTDANARVYNQIRGLEEQEVPMLYLATAYKGFAMHYRGKKYIICQNGYDKAEALAGEKGWNLYETGGSVSTTILDVCIRLGCSSIAFIGLDLAYTDNLAHAEGTSRRVAEEAEEMERVPAIGGGKVPASKLFLMYNRWIANRVGQPDVTMPVYDATEGGAVVPGLKVTTLLEYFEGISHARA